MKRKYKIVIAALALVAVLTTVLATTAFAASGLKTPGAATLPVVTAEITPVATPTNADYQAWGCPMANGNYEAIANLLGMTPQEIDAQLQQGKSLLEIATARGVSGDKLVAAIITPMQQFMQQQVTSGTWTQVQMDTHLKLAEQHIRQLVNARGNGDSDGGCGSAGSMMGGSTGGMMGSNSGGMMGSGSGGMMGGGSGGRTGGSFGGMMGNW